MTRVIGMVWVTTLFILPACSTSHEVACNAAPISSTAVDPTKQLYGGMSVAALEVLLGKPDTVRPWGRMSGPGSSDPVFAWNYTHIKNESGEFLRVVIVARPGDTVFEFSYEVESWNFVNLSDQGR